MKTPFITFWCPSVVRNIAFRIPRARPASASSDPSMNGGVLIVRPLTDRLSDAVSPHQAFVEDQAEARILRHLHDPVLDRGTVRPHRLPHGIALGVGEALDVGAVRHRREQVLGDLRLFVVRHLHAGRAAHERGAPPLGDAAALRATSTRLASSSGVSPPTLNLQPAIPAWRYASISRPMSACVLPSM